MAATPPLLHIANSVVTITTVDPRILAVGAAALAAVLAFFWAGAVETGLRCASRSRRRFAMGVLVALAVLPSVIPYDHLLPVGHDTHAATETDRAHASHCHDSPGSCADAPVTSGPGQFLTAEPLIPLPAMLSILVPALFVAALYGVARRPELPPPLALA